MFSLPWRYPTARLHDENRIELIANFLDRLRDQFVASCTLNIIIIIIIIQPIEGDAGQISFCRQVL